MKATCGRTFLAGGHREHPPCRAVPTASRLWSRNLLCVIYHRLVPVQRLPLWMAGPGSANLGLETVWTAWQGTSATSTRPHPHFLDRLMVMGGVTLRKVALRQVQPDGCPRLAPGLPRHPHRGLNSLKVIMITAGVHPSRDERPVHLQQNSNSRRPTPSRQPLWLPTRASSSLENLPAFSQ